MIDDWLLKRLSYIMQTRTKKIVDLRDEKNKYSNRLLIVFAPFAISLVYIFSFFSHYIYLPFIYPVIIGFMDILNLIGITVNNSQNTSAFVKIIDVLSLCSFSISGLYLYYISCKLKRITSQFEDLKKCITKLADTDFCSCNSGCNCKNQYVEQMETKAGINLLF